MIRINNLQKNFGTKKAVDIENYTIGQGDMLGQQKRGLEELHGSLYRRRFPDRLPHPRRILLLHR